MTGFPFRLLYPAGAANLSARSLPQARPSPPHP